MRIAIDEQMKFGETSISDIKFDARCRDELPQLLMGLQSLYCNKKIRLKIFDTLQDLIPEDISLTTGRKGMNLWRIFVLGCVRLCCDTNFDKLHDMANWHGQLRQMLGHSIWDLEKHYALSTLKDNLSLFTPEVLDKISQIAVEHGHEVFNKKTDEILKGSCDSFPLETNVHYPTDISVLWDAVRKIITLTMMLCKGFNISEWRQGKINLQKVKACFRHAQQAKRSTSNKEEVKKEKEQLVIIAHTLYVNLAQGFIDKARQTLKTLPSSDIVVHCKVQQIEEYCNDAELLIDQIKRRVVNGETIPHHEKIFFNF